MTEPDLSAELRKLELEPLLPIEKKLIGWCLAIGVTLLIVLAIVNHSYRSERSEGSCRDLAQTEVETPAARARLVNGHLSASRHLPCTQS